MPVNLDDHEPIDVRPGTNEAAALRFLYEHADYGFTPAEVREATEIPDGSTHKALARLCEKGYVGQTDDGFYHALDDAQVAAFARSLQAADAFNGEGSPDSTPAAESAPHREAAKAFVQRVRDELADAVTDLYVFGSVARDEARSTSDVDVLVVIAPEAEYEAVDDRLLEIAYDIQLDRGVRIEVHSLRASEFTARKDANDPFVQTVLDEGEAYV